MTKRNLDSAASPREKAQAMREAQARQDRRIRRTIITVVSVAVVAIVVAVTAVIINSKNQQTSQSADSSQVLGPYADGSPVVVSHLGVGKKDDSLPTLTEYFDYTCHYCAMYDVEMGEGLSNKALEGAFNIEYQPVTTVGYAFQYSATTASLIVAQEDPDNWIAFHHALLAYFYEQYTSGNGAVVQDQEASFTQVKAIAADAGVSTDVISTFTQNSVDGYLSGTTKAWTGADIQGRDPNSIGTPEFVRDHTTLITPSGDTADAVLQLIVKVMEGSSDSESSNN